jgi:hypothetical protein
MEEPRRVLVVAWNVEDEALRIGIRMALDAGALLSVVVPRVKVSPFVFLAPGGASVPGELEREAERNLWRMMASVPAMVSVTGRVADLSGRRLRAEVARGCHDAVVVSRDAWPVALRRQIRGLERADPMAKVVDAVKTTHSTSRDGMIPSGYCEPSPPPLG